MAPRQLLRTLKLVPWPTLSKEKNLLQEQVFGFFLKTWVYQTFQTSCAIDCKNDANCRIFHYENKECKLGDVEQLTPGLLDARIGDELNETIDYNICIGFLCMDGWIPFRRNLKCYKLFVMKLNEPNARSHCEAQTNEANVKVDIGSAKIDFNLRYK